MKLNYHHLYYFWQVAKSGHLTRTAEALHQAKEKAEAGKEVGMGLPAAGHRALLKEAERLLEAAKAKKEQLAALPFEL